MIQLSVGEPTIHPDLSKFLGTVFETKVVPNYTTNGIILDSDTPQSEELLEATRNFVGGVAVSYGNKKKIRTQADKAIEKLLKDGDCKVMIHHLISDKNSVDELLKAKIGGETIFIIMFYSHSNVMGEVMKK